MRGPVFIDYFSGSIADLKRGMRTEENALRVLANDGRVSCFDRSEYRWLDILICDLEKNGLIGEDKSTSYPWQRFFVTDVGKNKLDELNGVKDG